MLRPRRKLDRRQRRADFSAIFAMLVALFVMLSWLMIPVGSCRGQSVDLPTASHAVLMGDARREDALRIAIFRDGKVFVDTELVTSEDLIAKLREHVRAGAPRKVYIQADVRVHYRAVKGVLDGVHSAGLTNVAFITEQRKTSEQ